MQYFPSYEVIVGQPTGHSLYEPDLREVSQFGVNEVMRQFFQVNKTAAVSESAAADIDEGFGYEQCDDSRLSQEAPQ